jgi:hypothetical protein
MDPLITPAAAAVAVPIVDRMKDWFRAEEEIVFEWTSPNYRKISILWELIVFERGERKTVRIRGKKRLLHCSYSAIKTATCWRSHKFPKQWS